MAKHEISETAAFEMLVRTSSGSKERMREIAVAIFRQSLNA